MKDSALMVVYNYSFSSVDYDSNTDTVYGTSATWIESSGGGPYFSEFNSSGVCDPEDFYCWNVSIFAVMSEPDGNNSTPQSGDGCDGYIDAYLYPNSPVESGNYYVDGDHAGKANLGHNPYCGSMQGSDINSYTTDSVTVNKPKVEILLNGSIITNTTQTVIVGQRINLTAEVTPSNTVSNHSWTIPSKAVKDFFVSADKKQGNEVAVDGLNTPSVSFAWVDGGGAQLEDFITKEVIYRATVNGRQLEGRATFRVKRPVVSLITETLTTNFLIDSTTNLYKLLFGDAITNGIIFKNTHSPLIPANFGGTIQWVQIVNSSSRSLVINGFAHTSESMLSGLDGCYPYEFRGRGITQDSPSLQFIAPLTKESSVTMNADDNFTMWLMYNPNHTGDGVWVPLKKVDWYWNAQARSGRSWNYSGNNSRNPAFQDTLDFPTWTSIVSDRSGKPCP